MVTVTHAFTGSFLATENARMMPTTRLAGILIPAMAFLSCLRPESWDPCVQVCVRSQFISCVVCLGSEKLPSAKNFPLCGALVSFICKKESNYLKEVGTN